MSVESKGVIPAKAGIQDWIPAYNRGDDKSSLQVEAHRPDGTVVPLSIETTAEGRRLSIPERAQASLIEIYETQGNEAYSTQTTLRIEVAAEARLAHYKLVREGPRADHQSFLEVHLQRAASLESHVFLFDGARIRNTLHVRVGEGGNCVLNGLYLATAEQVMETHTLIDHLKPHGTSRELYKGILDQKAQGLFDGLIVVEKDAQKTDSSQTNKNLLLSSDAKAKSNPELKILANDVKCKHGSTIGQIDAAQLFYLRSRGIPEEEARKLLIYAFASEMIESLPVVSLRERLHQLLSGKFQKGGG